MHLSSPISFTSFSLLVRIHYTMILQYTTYGTQLPLLAHEQHSFHIIYKFFLLMITQLCPIVINRFFSAISPSLKSRFLNVTFVIQIIGFLLQLLHVLISELWTLVSVCTGEGTLHVNCFIRLLVIARHFDLDLTLIGMSHTVVGMILIRILLRCYRLFF